MKRESGKKLILEELRKVPIIELACSKTGIVRATFYRWKKADSKFVALVEDALRDGNARISDVAESQLVASIKAGNLSAIVFWLKHHRDTYKTKVEVTGEIKAIHQELTPEQEALVREALRLAALPEPEKP